MGVRMDGKSPGLNSALAFDLGEDGIYRLAFRDGACSIEEGDGETQARVHMALPDAEAADRANG